MKKLTTLILTALMILSALPMMSFAGRFDDVAEGKWYSEGISFCAANEYMTGTSDNYFDRNGTLTRAMFVTILAKIDDADLAEYWGESSFTDVQTGKWYSTAIEWAYQNGLASGVGEGIFGYKLSITRDQIAVFLHVYAEYLNEKNKNDPEKQIDTDVRADLSVFTDHDRVRGWAKESMSWAVACGLFSGVGENIIDPRGNCTRAQAAVLIRAFVLNFLSDCEHEWIEPTCLEMGYCTKCDLKKATGLGHDFGDVLCTESVKCSRCDVMSEITEHDFTTATCTAASVCKKCGLEDAPAKGHSMAPATCTAPSKCKNCGITSGTAAGHKPNGSVTNPVCSVCGVQCFVDNTHKLKCYIRQGEVHQYEPNTYHYAVDRDYGFYVGIHLLYFADYDLPQLTGYWYYEDGIELQVCVEIPEIGNSYKFEAYLDLDDENYVLIGDGYLNPAYQTANPYVGFVNYYLDPQYENSYILEINEMLGYMFTTADEVFFTNNPYGLTMKDLGFVNF